MRIIETECDNCYKPIKIYILPYRPGKKVRRLLGLCCSCLCSQFDYEKPYLTEASRKNKYGEVDSYDPDNYVVPPSFIN